VVLRIAVLIVWLSIIAIVPLSIISIVYLSSSKDQKFYWNNTTRPSEDDSKEKCRHPIWEREQFKLVGIPKSVSDAQDTLRCNGGHFVANRHYLTSRNQGMGSQCRQCGALICTEPSCMPCRST
jgi:hypothetical protein